MNYVAALISIVTPPATNASASWQSSDAAAIARAQLTDLRQSIRSVASGSSGIKRSHLLDLLAQIEKALDTNK